MSEMEPLQKTPVRLKQFALTLAVLWTVAVGLVLAWNLRQLRNEVFDMATSHAESTFQKDLLYRRWAASHGGVYVPVTEQTPPNPYLADVPERDIETPSGRALTLINPAYMTRQVHELGGKLYGVRGHITSLKPIRPENAPDPWEADALRAFEQGKKRVTSIETLDGSPFFRFMQPLVTEEGCMKCHEQQGYKVGEIRGGISVSVPMAPLWAISHRTMTLAAFGHFILWVLGLGGIGLTTQRLKRRVDERERLLGELQEANSKIHTLRGIIPICSRCKKVRDDQGYWDEVEVYVKDHSEASFSHSLCPHCFEEEVKKLDEDGIE